MASCPCAAAEGVSVKGRVGYQVAQLHRVAAQMLAERVYFAFIKDQLIVQLKLKGKSRKFTLKAESHPFKCPRLNRRE